MMGLRNKTLFLLLSLALSQSVYANNENESEAQAREKGYLREQIRQAWKSVNPEVFDFRGYAGESGNVDHDATHWEPPGVNQGLYSRASANPILLDDSYPTINLILEDFRDPEGVVPYNAKFVQDVEVGVGFKRGDWRFEAIGQWTRFHVSEPEFHSLDFAPIVLTDFTFTVGGEPFSHRISTDRIHDFTLTVEGKPFRGVLDHLGLLGGLFRDWHLSETQDEVIYLGSAFGPVIVNLGNDHYYLRDDWVKHLQVEAGYMQAITGNTNFQIGVEWAWYGDVDYGDLELGSHQKLTVKASLINFYGNKKK